MKTTVSCSLWIDKMVEWSWRRSLLEKIPSTMRVMHLSTGSHKTLDKRFLWPRVLSFTPSLLFLPYLLIGKEICTAYFCATLYLAEARADKLLSRGRTKVSINIIVHRSLGSKSWFATFRTPLQRMKSSVPLISIFLGDLSCTCYKTVKTE